MRTKLFHWVLLACLSCVTACGGSVYGSLAATPVEAAEPAVMPSPDPNEPMAASTIDKDMREISGGDTSKGAELAKAAPGVQPAPSGGAAGQPGSSAGQAVAVRGPMLIYTAQVTMAVFEVNASLGKVEAIARDLGGFLAKRDDTTITIRVPVARFDEALARIEEAGDMLHRNVAVEDVTEEFTDLEIRLRNARAIRDRMEKLLEQAATVEESVLLERELGRVAGEIDRIEGRMKFLRDRAAFSTVTVSFQPRPRESIDPTGPRLPVSWLNELGLGRLLNL